MVANKRNRKQRKIPSVFNNNEPGSPKTGGVFRHGTTGPGGIGGTQGNIGEGD